MEHLWILIPAKSSTLAKSRLSPVLSEDARAILARLLLARLLTTISGAASGASVLVLSEDAGLRAIARLFGYQALADPVEPPGWQSDRLNAALEAGRAHALAHGATALLVLPTDLPYLSAAGLAHLLAPCAAPGPRVVLAADRAGTGTNALFMRPAGALPFRFGGDSAVVHRTLAARAALPVVEVRDAELAFDLDLPEDWERLVA